MTPPLDANAPTRRRTRTSAGHAESETMQDPSPRFIGQLEGRVLGIEDRLDRSDAATTARLTTIENKLDSIATTISHGMGGLQLAHWIAGGCLAALGFVASHFWPGKSG